MSAWKTKIAVGAALCLLGVGCAEMNRMAAMEAKAHPEGARGAPDLEGAKEGARAHADGRDLDDKAPHGVKGASPGDAMGKGVGAAAACTKMTMCITRLSGEVCLGVDKGCLDDITKTQPGADEAACQKTLDGLPAKAKRHAKIPGWKYPDECK